MPSRRHHAKSRNGCLQCKKSHVKCDESFPQCSYCQRRQLQCSFLSNTTSSRHASGSRDATPNVALAHSEAVVSRHRLEHIQGRPPTHSPAMALQHIAGPSRDVVRHSPLSPHRDLNHALNRPPMLPPITSLPTQLPPITSLPTPGYSSGHLSGQSSAHTPQQSSAHTPQQSSAHTPQQSSAHTSQQSSVAGSEHGALAAKDQLQPKLMDVRTREAYLMHIYTTTSRFTFSQGEGSDQIFDETTKREAWRHSFLLDGIFGLTALHCAFLNPARSAEWSEIALEYQNRALADFGRIVANITPELSHAAVVFTIIIMFLTFAMPCEDGMDPIAYVLLHRYHIRGITAIINDSQETLGQGAFGVIIDPSRRNHFAQAPGEEVEKGVNRLYTMSESSEHSHSYFVAITGLIEHIRNFSLTMTGWSTIFLDDNFITLLHRRDSMALLIMAHYGILLHCLDDRWWMRGVGRKHVDSMTQILLGQDPPAPMREAAEWARAQVGLKTETPQSY